MGRECERACGTRGGPGCTCAGCGPATGGRVRVWAPRRGVGAGGYGARWRRAGKSPGVSAQLSPPPTRNFARAARPEPWGARGWGRGSRAAGGGQPEEFALRPVRSRHPATAGRSLRARGAPRGAAILASSLRTRGGLGGRPAGLGVRTSQVQGVTRAGPEGRGAETVGRVLAMALISPEVQGREVQGRMNVC